MVVGGSRQETLNPGSVLLDTRQQGVPVILRELVLPGGFDLVSPGSRVSYRLPPSNLNTGRPFRPNSAEKVFELTPHFNISVNFHSEYLNSNR
ncbi:unnamed protein product [Schistosoma margrebowiei]|uniref:Uncharacterized protein n=1 Tax=Schistosoma margrebowiei TaxID=48269 RepID=A0A183L9N6_9TREM|nr:unnamed protein product [Schistosoma margrebowiei]